MLVFYQGGFPMLVLTRKAGETITIDGNIVIQIVQVRGKQVRVGIEAPKEKKVQRGELVESSSLLKTVGLSNDSPSVKTF